MIRTLFAGLTAFAAAAAPVVAAPPAGTCPALFDDALRASLGSPTATADGLKLFQPRSLAVLGRPVSYAIVGKDLRVDAVWFRLAGETRYFARSLPKELRDPFNQAFPDYDCGDDGDACFSGDPEPGKAPMFAFARLTDDAPLDAGWSGPGAAPIVADRALKQDRAYPVYLICYYYD